MLSRFEFASDTTSGMCPEAASALLVNNAGFAAPYGADQTTRMAADAVRHLLDCDADVRFLPSGTAANAIAMGLLVAPHQTMLAHSLSHLLHYEAGAPALFAHGAGLRGVPGSSGRMDPIALSQLLSETSSIHGQRSAALSITNATECGTVYSVAELRVLVGMAKEHGLAIHVDGARLAHAVAAGFDPRQLPAVGVTALVIGGSKAGAGTSDALVVIDKMFAEDLDVRLKRAGQLIAKGRLLSAPWLGLLEGSGRETPWVRHASHANAMARRLAALMPFPISHSVESNAVFVDMPDVALDRLRGRGWTIGRFVEGSARFLCSWATTPDHVDEIGCDLAAIF